MSKEEQWRDIAPKLVVWPVCLAHPSSEKEQGSGPRLQSPLQKQPPSQLIQQLAGATTWLVLYHVSKRSSALCRQPNRPLPRLGQAVLISTELHRTPQLGSWPRLCLLPPHEKSLTYLLSSGAQPGQIVLCSYKEYASTVHWDKRPSCILGVKSREAPTLHCLWEDETWKCLHLGSGYFCHLSQ